MNQVDAVKYPNPADADLEEVHCSLSVGATLWSRGDEEEALKWLRRAAEAAADSEADMRAVELFKAAADITTMLESNEKPPSAAKSAPRAKKSQPKAKKRQPSKSKAGRKRRFPDDDQEMTMVRPETALRRALTRIDPGYPDRIDLPGGQDQSPAPAAGQPATPPPSEPAPKKAAADASSMADTTKRTRKGRRKLKRQAKAEESTAASDVASSAPSSAPSDAASDDPSRDPAGAPSDDPFGDPSGVHSRNKPRQATVPGISDPIGTAAPTGILPALRVALLTIAEEGEVRLLFLNPDEEPPPGVPTAMLVATSPEEAERLHTLFETTKAKL